MVQYLELLESLCMIQRLLSWLRNLTKRQVQRPKSYRDRDGAEVDIIVETPRGVIAGEVKSAVAAPSGHFKHMKRLRDRLGDEVLAGVVLTTGTAARWGSH